MMGLGLLAALMGFGGSSQPYQRAAMSRFAPTTRDRVDLRSQPRKGKSSLRKRRRKRRTRRARARR